MEVLTIDKAQGIDDDLIVMCCSERNLKQMELLNNWKRVNVALTRAKKKLLLIGSVEKLKGLKFMNSIIVLLERKNWVYDFEGSELTRCLVN